MAAQREKQVQIPEELFYKVVSYFFGKHDDALSVEEAAISKGLKKKLNSIIDHELYTKSITAPTEEQKEIARNEYLDRRGIPHDFRW